MSWAALASLGHVWGVPWVHLGVPEGVLEASWANFEGSWNYFGASWVDFRRGWRSLGSFLGPFWEYFWKIICHLKENVKIAKNLGKPMVFH